MNFKSLKIAIDLLTFEQICDISYASNINGFQEKHFLLLEKNSEHLVLSCFFFVHGDSSN